MVVSLFLLGGAAFLPLLFWPVLLCVVSLAWMCFLLVGGAAFSSSVCVVLLSFLVGGGGAGSPLAHVVFLGMLLVVLLWVVLLSSSSLVWNSLSHLCFVFSCHYYTCNNYQHHRQEVGRETAPRRRERSRHQHPRVATSTAPKQKRTAAKPNKGREGYATPPKREQEHRTKEKTGRQCSSKGERGECGTT